ncbi:hypothetical protein CB0940_06771 [Cercospora beticola]|uniref:Uncharacterized protein n=1 Tax=Cercospora beticola TaxID=122368 RepID=A0A2G5H7U8_CERBT|nr:hypothetical protein CB0940_06771 [Cercospora beticola]PIA88605.1 hypothetical protein CB0940_06771 [Cercospora beticola]WPB02683.1 hypothetical protein RHO25_007319 [Cercospora beticola]
MLLSRRECLILTRALLPFVLQVEDHISDKEETSSSSQDRNKGKSDKGQKPPSSQTRPKPKEKGKKRPQTQRGSSARKSEQDSGRVAGDSKDDAEDDEGSTKFKQEVRDLSPMKRKSMQNAGVGLTGDRKAAAFESTIQRHLESKAKGKSGTG